MFWLGVLLAILGLGGGAYLIVNANGRGARTDNGIFLVIVGTFGMVLLMLDSFFNWLSRMP